MSRAPFSSVPCVQISRSLSRVGLSLRFFWAYKPGTNPLKSCSSWSWLQVRGLVPSEVPRLGLGPGRGLLLSSYCQFGFLVCNADTGLAERVAGAQISLAWEEGKELILKAKDMILLCCSNYANGRLTLCNILMLQTTSVVESKLLSFWKNCWEVAEYWKGLKVK